MFQWLGRIETRIFRDALQRQPHGFVERASFWLLLTTALGFVSSYLPGVTGGLAEALFVLSLLAVTPLLLILFFRWMMQRALWKVRNRLVVTYLLMGLAPVVLFGTLAAIASYLFSGQFATNTAVAALDEQLDVLKDKSVEFAGPVGHALELNPNTKLVLLPMLVEPGRGVAGKQKLAIAAWHDGLPLPLRSDAPQDVSLGDPVSRQPLPGWAHIGFSGVVEDRGRLYLRAVNGYTSQGHSLLVLASMPLEHGALTTLAQGLGTVIVIPQNVGARGGKDAELGDADTGERPEPFHSVRGGALPPARHFFDTPVFFSAPLHLTAWTTGSVEPARIEVVSRPALLYERLFANSVEVGAVVRNVLASIAAGFGLIELFAFLMAVRLSQTITRSVADLYGATRQIDRGNFGFRIPVKRRDQLAALATSFNLMAGSLENLLEQQREKERLQRELEIAQEVQRTFFPSAPPVIAGFELHGVCKPARTVSGDYYDFLLAGEGQICFALGDISGKGISAALLMASLHSAVRAFQFSDGERGERNSLPSRTFTSPGKMLALLNRHLYLSTQPEKYATLFLACYDSRTRRLTYSNGGQPPPLVLCANGSVERLDCGGSVIGLLDGLEYEEATVSLSPGDLLVAYSDGITEPENSRGEFGEDRLVAVVERARQQSLASISDHTMQALDDWIGDAEQPDDITLVLARQR